MQVDEFPAKIINDILADNVFVTVTQSEVKTLLLDPGKRQRFFRAHKGMPFLRKIRFYGWAGRPQKKNMHVTPL